MVSLLPTSFNLWFSELAEHAYGYYTIINVDGTVIKYTAMTFDSEFDHGCSWPDMVYLGNFPGRLLATVSNNHMLLMNNKAH